MADKGNSSTVVAGSGETTAIPSGTPKKAVVSKSAKDADAKPVRPRTSRMVNDAITDLNEHGGSSLQAIKKYMVNKYKVDAEQQATFIKKYLKAAVASGILIQTKGKGAAGSFKLGSAKTEVPKSSSRGRGRPPSKAKALKPHFSKADASTTKKAAASKKAAGSVAKKTTKKAAIAAVAEKKKVSKGPAAKPPKSKTTKAKSPAKKAKPAAAKPKPAVVETKKVVGRKSVSKK